MRVLLFIFLFPLWSAYGQGPEVPARMEFAGIKLRLMDDARQEIQKDVDALTKSPKYFNIKAERARSYFPIIERIFREEGLHDDFKYLVLQESALISDAVSVSDAVGFWQFKDFTAMEVGMRVDNHVDERMNIVASTRGAARYMKKNNAYFDNWLHTLQAYQMGAGGAMRALKKDEKGARSMVIDKKTYWYVKKYLAHKIAFEQVIGPGEIRLMEYTNGSNKSLKDISKETGVSEEVLETYNKWLKRGKIPDDKEYTVIIPIKKLDNINLAALKSDEQPPADRKMEYRFSPDEVFPKIDDEKMAARGQVVEINNLPGVLGRSGDKITALAEKGGVDLSKFLKYNDIEINDPIVEGQVYYFKSKRAKAMAHYYVIQPDETLWSVSQKFGIKLKKLKMKNRIRGDEQVKPGRVLWLRYLRPARIAIEYRDVERNPVAKKETVVEKEKKPEPPENVENNIKEDEMIKLDSSDVKKDTLSAVVTEPIVIEEKEETDDAEEVGEDSVAVNLEEEEYELIKKVHVVKPGETLYAISKQYEVKVKELLDWNNLNISDGISIDQKLVILKKSIPREEVPPSSKEAEVFVYHTVKQGDTLYGIARSYNVTIEEIMTWNDKKNFSVDLGEKLKIRKGEVN